MPLATGVTADFRGNAVLKKSTVPALNLIASKALRIMATVTFVTLLLTTMFVNMNAQILPKNSPVRFLALGDSYTIGESVAEVQRWPIQLADALRKKGYTCERPEIIAVTGWRTDQLKRAIVERRLTEDYDLVS